MNNKTIRVLSFRQEVWEIYKTTPHEFRSPKQGASGWENHLSAMFVRITNKHAKLQRSNLARTATSKTSKRHHGYYTYIFQNNCAPYDSVKRFFKLGKKKKMIKEPRRLKYSKKIQIEDEF